MFGFVTVTKHRTITITIPDSQLKRVLIRDKTVEKQILDLICCKLYGNDHSPLYQWPDGELETRLALKEPYPNRWSIFTLTVEKFEKDALFIEVKNGNGEMIERLFNCLRFQVAKAIGYKTSSLPKFL